MGQPGYSAFFFTSAAHDVIAHKALLKYCLASLTTNTMGTCSTLGNPVISAANRSVNCGRHKIQIYLFCGIRNVCLTTGLEKYRPNLIRIFILEIWVMLHVIAAGKTVPIFQRQVEE
jgi:hypothetical protein